MAPTQTNQLPIACERVRQLKEGSTNRGSRSTVNSYRRHRARSPTRHACRWLARATVRTTRRARSAGPRFVVLVDGSRSMSDAASTALELAVAIAAATMRIEAFTFSTGLRRVTDEVRRAAAGDTVRIDRLQHAWGGGTAIGECLRDFL
ncbi:MAG: hypothetical protein DMG01_29740, partial [Acidobacteria bacterium]